MKKIVTLLTVLCVLNIIAIIGLVAFLMATGRLDKVKAQAIADLLRHQGTPDKLRDHVYDILEPIATTRPATGPASRPVSATADAGPVTSQERLDYTRQAMELDLLQIENERQKLLEEQKRLAGIQLDVDLKLKAIEAQKKTIDQSLAQNTTKADDATFQRTLALYDEMKPKQIKDIFMAMPQDAVTKYVAAMEPERAAKIIAEFKSAEEKTYINAVLERLRGAGTNSASGNPATTAPATSRSQLSAAAPRATPPSAP